MIYLGIVLVLLGIVLVLSSIGEYEWLNIFGFGAISFSIGLLMILTDVYSPKIETSDIEYICTDSLTINYGGITFNDEYIIEKKTIEKKPEFMLMYHETSDIEYKLIKKYEVGDLDNYKPLIRK